MMTTQTELLDCGHMPTIPGHCGTGVALRADGRTCCYVCADMYQAAAIASAEPGDRTTAYVSSDGRSITSWSGGRLMGRVTFGKVHPWSQEVRYLTAVDGLGRTWSGTGSAGMLCSLRLTLR